MAANLITNLPIRDSGRGFLRRRCLSRLAFALLTLARGRDELGGGLTWSSAWAACPFSVWARASRVLAERLPRTFLLLCMPPFYEFYTSWPLRGSMLLSGVELY